jgi:hypothetical protein
MSVSSVQQSSAVLMAAQTQMLKKSDQLQSQEVAQLLQSTMDEQQAVQQQASQAIASGQLGNSVNTFA